MERVFPEKHGFARDPLTLSMVAIMAKMSHLKSGIGIWTAAGGCVK